MSGVGLDISRLPDFLKQYIDLASEHTNAHPGSLLTAILPYISVNLGNRIYIEHRGKKHSARIWAMILGDSGVSRKSTCMRLASQTMQPYKDSLVDLSAKERGRQNLEINSVTNAKLISLLSENPTRLLSFEEISLLFSSTSQSFNNGMRANLTSLYDGDSKSICNMDRSEHIDNPALSIIGASTPSWFHPYFQESSEQGSGFLQRFIYCVIADDPKQLQTKWDEKDLDYDGLYAYDNIYRVFRAIPGHFKLHIGSEVGRHWETAHNTVMEKIARIENKELLAYAVRIYNNLFFSLLVLFTAMKNHDAIGEAIRDERCEEFFGNLRVDLQTAEEVLYLCEYYMENAKPMISIIHEAGTMEKQRQVIRHLLKLPGYCDNHSNIMNKFRLNKKAMSECMETLIERGFVELREDSRGIRRARAYGLLLSSSDASLASKT